MHVLETDGYVTTMYNRSCDTVSTKPTLNYVKLHSGEGPKVSVIKIKFSNV